MFELSIDSLDLIDWQGALSLVEPKTTYDWPGPRGRGGKQRGKGQIKEMLRMGKKNQLARRHLQLAASPGEGEGDASIEGRLP